MSNQMKKSGEVVKETEEDKEESVEQAEDGGADSAQGRN